MQTHYLCLLCKWTLEIRRVNLKMLWVDIVEKNQPKQNIKVQENIGRS